MARVTLQTIADHVGVSQMTVSNAFSRPDQLSARLRDKVLAVADELGRCPHACSLSPAVRQSSSLQRSCGLLAIMSVLVIGGGFLAAARC
jgi:hypothetical protein